MVALALEKECIAIIGDPYTGEDLLNTFLLISYAQHKFLSEIKESRSKRFSFYLVKILVQV